MLNHITLMGRLTRDPEYRATATGISISNFTLAVDRDFSGRDGGEKETDFIDCVAWRKTAEFITKYFQKGSLMVVSGRLQIESWTDKDGNKRKSAKVNVDNAYFGGAKKETSGSNTDSGQYSAYPETQEAINRYMGSRQQAPVYPDPGEYPMLTDDDAQLPF